jgi:hypothetical protein
LAGHPPANAVHPRRDQALKEELQAEEKRCKLLGYRCAEDVCYRERTIVERVNARLKDEFGGRTIRVRGYMKVMCHLNTEAEGAQGMRPFCFIIKKLAGYSAARQLKHWSRYVRTGCAGTAGTLLPAYPCQATPGTRAPVLW